MDSIKTLNLFLMSLTFTPIFSLYPATESLNLISFLISDRRGYTSSSVISGRLATFTGAGAGCCGGVGAGAGAGEGAGGGGGGSGACCWTGNESS